MGDIAREWVFGARQRIDCPETKYPDCFDAKLLVQHANPSLPRYHD